MATIADIARRSRAAVIDHFLGFDATSAEAARVYQPQGHAERRALAYLMTKRIIRLSADGRHWIDAAAAEAWRRENLVRAAWLIGGAAAAIGGLIAWQRLRNRANKH